MAGSNQYLTFGVAPGANVLSPVDYLALGARSSGFSAGVADPREANTPWRQASVAAAAIAQLVVDVTGVDMLDDGSPNNYRDKFAAMLSAVVDDAIDASGSFGSGGLFGLTMSNSVANPTTRITVSVGQCRDSTNSANINLVTPITKDLTAAWGAGNNAGGRDTGALAAGQTWFMFMILNPTSNVLDSLFSQSPTAPVLPVGYTKFRRIGAVVLEAATTLIRQFKQIGDYFEYKIRSTDFAVQANGGGPFLRQISVPNGIKVEATMYFQSTGTASLELSGVFDPDLGAPPAYGPLTQWAQARRIDYLSSSQGGYQSYFTGVIRQFTDANAKVYTFSNDGSDVIALGVLGWKDDRGRFY